MRRLEGKRSERVLSPDAFDTGLRSVGRIERQGTPRSSFISQKIRERELLYCLEARSLIQFDLKGSKFC